MSATDSTDPTILNPYAQKPPSLFSQVTSWMGTGMGAVSMGTQLINHIVDAAIGTSITPLQGALYSILNNPAFGAVTAGLSAISAFQGVQSMYKNGPTLMGAAMEGMNMFGIASGISILTHTSLFGPGGWLIAGAVISSSITFAAIQDMFLNGVTAKGVILTAATFLATWGLIGLATTYIQALNVIPGLGLIVAGAVVLISIIWALLHPKPAEQTAAENLNSQASSIVWSAGPVVFVGLGTVAALMGWPKTGVPIMSTLTLPVYQIANVIQSHGSQVAQTGDAKTPAVYVERGATADQPTRVMIVSPDGTDSHGNPMDTIQAYTLAPNMQFQAPQSPDQGYIPFFIYVNGKPKPNPDVLQAFKTSFSQLRGAMSGTVITLDAMKMVEIAASTNKYGAHPAGYY